MSVDSWRRRAAGWVEAHPRASMAKQTLVEFLHDDAPLHAAALAFFSLFAVGPLFVLVIVGAGALWGGDDGARGALFAGAEVLLGEDNADALQELIRNVDLPGSGLGASLVGAAILLFAASRVFLYLEKSLNRIWDVEPRTRSIGRAVRKRFLSLASLLGVAFLLLVSLVLTSAMRGLADAAADRVPFDPLIVMALRVVVTLLLLTGVFAALYKYIPAAVIEWRDVGVGAVGTAALFVVGQFAIGRGIGQSALASSFGGLASIVVLLLWFYYAALIFILGAEFTQVYARRHGKPLRPMAGVARRRGDKPDAADRRPAT